MSRVAGKAKVKWEAKKWFKVLAPSVFGFAELGYVPANSEDSMVGHTVEVSLYDITKDVSQLPVKLKFQVVRVEGDDAHTQLKLMELARDYTRSLVRRGTSKVDTIVDVMTKDGVRLRVMVLAVTERRVKTSQRKTMRGVVRELVEGKASSMPFGEFVQEVVLGRLSAEVEIAARKIYPLRKAEVRKIKVLTNTFEMPSRRSP